MANEERGAMKENFEGSEGTDNLPRPEESPFLPLDTGATWIHSAGDLLSPTGIGTPPTMNTIRRIIHS